MRIKIFQSHSAIELAKMLEDYMSNDPKLSSDVYLPRRIDSVTVGPDNAEAHQIGGQIYTAWISVGTA